MYDALVLVDSIIYIYICMYVCIYVPFSEGETPLQYLALLLVPGHLTLQLGVMDTVLV